MRIQHCCPPLDPQQQNSDFKFAQDWKSVSVIVSLFSRPRKKKKGFSFFSCGATPSRTGPKTQPHAGRLFSTRKSRSEVPERGDFGEENWLRKSGQDRTKKGKKDAQKQVGNCELGENSGQPASAT